MRSEAWSLYVWGENWKNKYESREYKQEGSCKQQHHIGASKISYPLRGNMPNLGEFKLGTHWNRSNQLPINIGDNQLNQALGLHTHTHKKN
jgi:hypothetical protein